MITKEIKFLLTHSSIYGLGTVVSRILAFILLPLYTRYLTPADYGVLETIDISTAMIGIILTVGISQAFSRFYYAFEGQKKRNMVVSTTYITYSLIACPFLPLFYFFCNPLAHLLFGSPYYGHLFKLGFTTLVIGFILDIGMMYLRLTKKPAIFIAITISQLILLILFNIFFIVYVRLGVLGILYSSLIVKALYGLLMTTSILWKTKCHFSVDLSRNMLKYGFPLIPSNLAYTSVKQSDKYFVLYFLSIRDMGIYSLAMKLGTAVHYLLTVPFITAYIPRRFEIMNRDDASEIYKKVFTYYVFSVVYIGCAISTLIPEILQTMVTGEFKNAGRFVPLIVLSMVIFGCHYHLDFGILYSRKTKYLAYINITCAACHLGLNYFLIRTYGLFGAVWSSIIALGLQGLLLFVFSEKFYHIEYEFKRIFGYILIAGICYGLSTLVCTKIMVIDFAVKLMLLALIPYAMILLNIISADERERFRIFFATKIKSRILGVLCLKTN